MKQSLRESLREERNLKCKIRFEIRVARDEINIK